MSNIPHLTHLTEAEYIEGALVEVQLAPLTWITGVINKVRDEGLGNAPLLNITCLGEPPLFLSMRTTNPRVRLVKG